jgi:choline kinase
MQAVILAGGFGIWLCEETAFRPKPVVEIGGRPVRFEEGLAQTVEWTRAQST